MAVKGSIEWQCRLRRRCGGPIWVMCDIMHWPTVGHSMLPEHFSTALLSRPVAGQEHVSPSAGFDACHPEPLRRILA